MPCVLNFQASTSVSCGISPSPSLGGGGGGGGGGAVVIVDSLTDHAEDVLRTKTKHVSFIFRALNCLKLVCQLRSDVIYAPVVQKVDNAIHQVKISIHGI